MQPKSVMQASYAQLSSPKERDSQILGDRLLKGCFKGELDTVKDLVLNNKVDVNFTAPSPISKKLITGLYLASTKRHAHVVEFLLENGADFTISCAHGNNPLTSVCHGGYNEIVALLLANGANPNEPCRGDGSLALNLACREGHLACVIQLLENGAIVTKCDDSGLFPLFAAAEKGHLDVVKKLIEYGARYNQVRKGGLGVHNTACEAAKICGHVKVVEYLKSLHASKSITSRVARLSTQLTSRHGYQPL